MTRVLVGVLCLNIAVITFCMARWGFPHCLWCHKRYFYRRSSSSFPFVFCSYRCNYWDMRDHLASKLDVDLAEVERYLNRHGWIHPEHLKEGR